MLLSVLKYLLKDWVGALAVTLAPTVETIPVGVGQMKSFSFGTQVLEWRGRSLRRGASWIAAKRKHNLPLEEECPALFANWQKPRTQ